MQRRRFSLACLGALAIVSIMLVPSATAVAVTSTYDVVVGQFLAGAPAESMRFFPSTIDVHQGDVLHFTSDSFHTATLLPVGAGPVEWFDANATGDAPYAILQRDKDDGARAYVFSTPVALPTDPTCGGPSQPICSFDGTSVLNSGIPLAGPMEMSVSVDVAPGNTIYVVCLIHGAMMRMGVHVVKASRPASDPAALAAGNAAAIAQDTDSAAALDAKFSSMYTSHETATGTVWDAWAGVENRYVTLYGMYPKKLKIARGDTVQWHFDQLNYEIHTVTFPMDTAKAVADNSFFPVCDTGAGADSPPDLPGPPFCSDPSQLELQLDNRFVAPHGDGSFEGTDYQNSGVRGGVSPIGDANYDLSFGYRSGDTPFQYICLVHEFMRGRIVVR